MAATPSASPAQQSRSHTPQLMPATYFTPISVATVTNAAATTETRTLVKRLGRPRHQNRLLKLQTQPPLIPRELKPAPPRQTPPPPPPSTSRTCFYDLPAELRIEVYKLVLESVTIHILPLNSSERHCPHALVRTSRQVRLEVLPLIHSLCEVRANVTDFNFDGLIEWLSRIPPDQHANLTKNKDLCILLCTTLKPVSKAGSLRAWLKLRADPYRPQPDWKYSGPTPLPKVANDLRRRAKRMNNEAGKQAELINMLKAIEVPTDDIET